MDPSNLPYLEGHKKICPICNREINAIGGNPMLWPIGVASKFSIPGKIVYYCTGCVSKAMDDVLETKRE